MSRRDLGILAGLVALVLAAYGRVLGHGFVHYDVDQYLVENAVVRRGLTLDGLRWAFTTGYAANWHPLTWLSHMLDVELFGMAPAGHHAVSVGMHALSACLLFLFLARATAAPLAAGLVAALFAVHPLRVESVAWAAERKDVLAGLFWMATLVAYERWVRRRGVWRHGLVVLFLALGLLAKPMVVTLPAVLLLLDVWPLGRREREGLGRLLLEKLPLLALVAASCVVTYRVQAAGHAMDAVPNLPLGLRAVNAVVAYGFYLGRSLWPVGLAPFYPHPELWRTGADTTQGTEAALVGLVLVALCVLFVRERRRRPWLLVGWLWFLGTLVPVIGLVQVGYQAWADRYAYLPLVGLHLALVYGLAELVRRGRVPRRVAAVAAGGVLLVLTGLSARQAGFWRSPRALWEHALAVTERNDQAHYGLASALVEAGEPAQAAAHFERAVEIRPSSWGAWFGLAGAREEAGDPAGAEEAYGELLLRRPRDGEMRYAHGTFLARQERFPEALAEYERAVAAGYDGGELRRNRALALTKLAVGEDVRRRLEEAVGELEASLRFEPGHPETLTYLGVVLLGLERRDEARRALEEAAAAGSAEARAQLARMSGG